MRSLQSCSGKVEVAAPSLSIILPVRNEARHLGDVLRQLQAQTLAPDQYEVLVVDGMSQDGTPELIRTFMADMPNLSLLENPDGLASHARNIGARAAQGQWVIFIDGHCTIRHPEMLAAALAAFRNGERCISRPQPLVAQDDTSFGAAVSLARGSVIGHYAPSKIYSSRDIHCNPLTAGCGYEAELFHSLGGIDEDFDAAEDLEFNYRIHRAGVKAYHSGTFTVEYRPRDSFMALFRQLYRYGYGRARLTRKHPQAISGMGLLLGLLALLLLFLPILGLLQPLAWTLWTGLFVPYVLLTGLMAGWRARGRGLTMAFWTWSSFIPIHLGAGLGYISGLLGGPVWSHVPPRAAAGR